MAEKQLKQTILITGASSGIGRETAVRLAKEGCKVFAGVRRKTDKAELEGLHSNIIGVYIDITNESSINKAFWFVMKHADKIDVLINNAGIAIAGPLECLTTRQLKEQFDVNTFGPVAVTQKFLPMLSGSKVINISSMAATGIFPFIAPYCASKRAADILLNNFALECKENIKFISVKPSAIKTPIWNKSVFKAKENLNDISDSLKQKYERELIAIEKNALQNNDKALEIYVVVDKIIKIVKAKNPKPSYTIGDAAMFSDWVSKFPQSVINKLIKMKLKNL